MDRRQFLKLTAALGGGAMLPWTNWAEGAPASQPGQGGWRPQMARFPQKADLILLTDRPPQLEMPVRYFVHDLTPNEAFFVRWHLAAIPTSVDTGKFRLSIG